MSRGRTWITTSQGQPRSMEVKTQMFGAVPDFDEVLVHKNWRWNMKVLGPLFANSMLVFALALAFTVSGLEAQSNPSFQVHPNHERGLSADTAYEVGFLDNINLFNGNLVLTLPIGQRFPVNGGFSWGLTLAYNSQLWDWDQIVTTCDLNGDGDTNDPGEAGPFSEAEPARETNAGLGWTLTPGRLELPPVNLPPDQVSYTLLSPDGAAHSLGPKIHPDHPDDAAYYGAVDPLQFVRLTLDGQPPNVSEYTLEYGDGTIYTFDREGRATRIEDRFGNGVSITPPAAHSGTGDWVFEDDHGRTVTIVMVTGTGGKARIDRISFPVFGEPADSGLAEYVFSYQQAAIPSQSDQDYCQAPNTFPVDLLSTITLPDGSSYDFEYVLSDLDDREGMISAVDLPTGGRYEWDHIRVDYEDTGPDDPTQEYPPFLQRSFGVGEKRHLGLPGSGTGGSRELLATWTYRYRVNTLDLFEGHAQEKRTIVVEPNGRTRYHYFNLRIQGYYALPFTFRQEDPEAPGSGRYLSTIVLDPTRVPDGSGGVFEIPQDPLEATYLRYDFDPIATLPRRNPKIVQSRTYFYDRAGPTTSDPCGTPPTDGDFHWVQVDNEDYDGLGHFRTRRVTGSLDDEDELTTTTDYDLMGNGAYPYVPPTTPWMIDVYSEQTVTDEGGQTNKVETCFDRTTGFLLRRRVLAQDTGDPIPLSGRDFLTVFEPEPSTGNLAAELAYGGDGAGVGSGDLCDLANLGTLGYRIQHSYEFGVQSGSEFVEPSTGDRVLTLLDLDVDRATGLVSAARDAAGVETTYDYDDLGRVTSIVPTDDARYESTYTAASGTEGSRVELQRTHSNNVLRDRELFFDGFGRVIEERGRLPAPGGGHQWSRRIHRYDGQGRKTAVSGAQPESTSDPAMKRTTFSYDVLGRVCRETRADGSVTKVWNQGISLAKQRTTVRGLNGTVKQLRFYGRDVHGRLQWVQENSGLSDGAVKTLYHYDPAGRLEQVCSPTPPPPGVVADSEVPLAQSCGSPQQRRRFDYDGRGALTRECHPEKGYTGTGDIGCVRYRGFDALGNPGTRRDGSDAFEVSFGYDLAGRLTQVRKGPPSTPGALIKEFFFGKTSEGGNLMKDRLYQAKRHNYLPDPATQVETDFVVTETYRYEGPEGRISDRRTTVSDQRLDSGEALSFNQSFTYNALGSLIMQTYPECLHAACRGKDPIRQVSYTYSDGFLTGVLGFADAITYHANGALAEVTHSNDLQDVVGLDPGWLVRPESLAVWPSDGGGPLWESGRYSYDEAGSIESIGSDEYYYDQVSRLVRAEVDEAGTTHTETYQYDHFGNMTSIGPAGTPRTYGVSLQSNRITDSGYDYDVAGNLIASPAGTFAYDALGMLTTAGGTAKYEHYVYTADDERIAQLDVQAQPPSLDWTLRSLDMKVLRTYGSDLATGDRPATWSWVQDYIYRGSSLLATLRFSTGGRQEHFHLDHLGTPRLLTSATGAVISSHKYLPFGEELGDPSVSNETMRFTGHERDADPVGWENDLDYMHARYYSPRAGRFTSVDPGGFDTKRPQTWNRYAYVSSNPILKLDPDGRDEFVFIWQSNQEQVGHAAFGIQLRDDYGRPDGRVEVRHLWPARPVGKSLEAPADYRTEIIQEDALESFEGGEGRKADGILRIAGNARQDAAALLELEKLEANKTYTAPSNTCSTFCAAAVEAVGIDVDQVGTVSVYYFNTKIKEQEGVTTPVSVYNSIVDSDDARVTVIVPLSDDNPDIEIR